VRTLKRVALLGALSVAALAATASSASAITVDPAGEDVTFTAGATVFDALIDVSCTSATVTGKVPNAPANTAPGTAANPVGPISITLVFNGCNVIGGSITCTGLALSVANDGVWSTITSDADVKIILPVNACQFTLTTGCQLSVTRGSARELFGDAYNEVPGMPPTPPRIVMLPKTLPYAASGGLNCLFITQGNATWQGSPKTTPASSVEFKQTGGTWLTVS
jgi:hypothetical protein